MHLVVDGTHISHALPGKFLKFEDTKAPELVSNRVLRYKNGDPVIQFGVKEKGSSKVEVGVSFAATDGDTVQKCTFNIPRGFHSQKSCLFSLPDSLKITRAKVYLKDEAGNVRRKRIDPVLANPSSVLEEFEVHGDPRHKINVIIPEREWKNGVRGGFDGILKDNIEHFFTRYSRNLEKYRDYFNWYVVSFGEGICGAGSCPEGAYDFSSFYRFWALRRSDVLKGGNAVVVILDKRRTGGFSSGPISVIGAQSAWPQGARVFRHELFHSIWGLADEYGKMPAVQSNVTVSEVFFPQGKDYYDLDKYQNVWHVGQHCREETEYYSNYGPEDCKKQV
ncbi:MAG: hypothetical protein ABEJ72_01985, partial [Candidatus Aenigmatarchaeota archaeon]